MGTTPARWPILAAAALIGLVVLWFGMAGTSAEEPAIIGMSPGEWETYQRATIGRLADGGRSRPGQPAAGLAAAAVTTVGGSVLDQNGAPLVGALIFALPGNPPAAVCPGVPTPSPTPRPAPGESPPITAALSNDDGSFSLSLRSGRWYLAASKSGLLIGGQAARYVTVGSADVSGVILRLIDVPERLTGTVRNSLGTPVSGGSVSAEGQRRIDGRTEYVAALAPIAPSGAFSVPVVTGTWSLATRAGDGDLQTGLAGLPISSTAGPRPIEISRLAPSGAISGRLIDDAGAPIPDAYLRASLIPPEPSSTTTASTATQSTADGAFALPVVAGDWAIDVAKEGYLTPAGLTLPGPSAGVSITLPVEAWCIQGTLALTDGAPALDAQVSASLAPPPGQTHGYRAAAQPDETGRYTLRVARGTWLVSALLGEASPPFAREVVVPPNATDVDFRLAGTPLATATSGPRLYLPAILRAGRAGW